MVEILFVFVFNIHGFAGAGGNRQLIASRITILPGGFYRDRLRFRALINPGILRRSTRLAGLVLKFDVALAIVPALLGRDITDF